MSDYTDELRQSLRYFVRLAQERSAEIDRLRARVAELETAIRAVQAEHTAEPMRRRPYCPVCSPQDGSWPCLVRLELDAVLPPEEQG